MAVSRSIAAVALAPVVVLLASAARLIIIARYDISTATTLATSGSIGQTILGTVIPLLPPYLPAALIALAVLRQWAILPAIAATMLLISPAYVETAQEAWDLTIADFQDAWDPNWFSEWKSLLRDSRILVYCVVAGALIAIADSVATLYEKPIRTIFATTARVVAVAVAASLTLLFVQNTYKVPLHLDELSAITLQKPWQSAEEVTLKSGETLLGYLLVATPGWYTFLTEAERTIRYIRPDDIAERVVCRIGPSAKDSPAPLIHLDIAPSDVPPCRSGTPA